MKKMTCKRKNLTLYILMFLFTVLFTFQTEIFAQIQEPEGAYVYDVTNLVIFQNGQFKEQYVTTDYIPLSLIGRSDGPAPAEETICLATGTYITTSSGILLEYQSDVCGIKQGTKVISFDQKDTIIIDGKAYVKTVSESESIRRARGSRTLGEIRAVIVADPDIEAGMKTWREHVAEAMKNLNNNYNGIWYCETGRPPRLSSSYWTWTTSVGDGGWIPNSSVNPSDAIEWYFGDVSNWEGCTECLMAARASFYKGLLDTIGTTSFNNWFSSQRSVLVVSNRSYAPSPLLANNPVISSENDLVKGDWVYFQNWVTAQNCPAINPLQGENAITQNSSGTRTYIGLGIPPRGQGAVTSTYILNELYDAWRRTSCPQERVSQLLKDAVITASPNYFSNANFKSLVRILQNNLLVSNLSDSKGSIKHYKFTVPSGVTSFEIRTSGGNGDCDLYVMRDKWASTVFYNEKSDRAGNNESVLINQNAVGT